VGNHPADGHDGSSTGQFFHIGISCKVPLTSRRSGSFGTLSEDGRYQKVVDDNGYQSSETVAGSHETRTFPPLRFGASEPFIL
jgi:hypothetical protein